MSDLPLFDYAREMDNSSTPRAPARLIPGADQDAVPEEVQRIFDYLRNCVGKDHAAKAADIAIALEIMADRTRDRRGDFVRRQINQYKLHAPFLIIADPKNGFYRPGDPDDITDYIQSMRHRFKEMWRNIRAVKLLAAAEGWQL